MNPNIPIACGALYALIYYGLARSALNDLARVDPDFYAHLGATRGIGRRNSFAIMEVLFDDRCPKDFYPIATKRKLTLARWLLLLSPVLIVAVVIALLV